MSRFGDLVKGKAAPTPVVEPTPAPEPVVEEVEVKEEVVAEEPVRARDERGHFIADDPSTPENEAWVGGISPKKSKKSKK